MNLSNAEKLILIMLSDLHSSLNIKSDVDPEFIQSAIHNDQAWAITWEYPGLNLTQDTPPIVDKVCQHLNMYTILLNSYNQLNAQDKIKVKTNAAPFDINFDGYDGNNEGEYMTAARFLTKELGRFQSLKDKAQQNSHYPTMEVYERMLREFKKQSHLTSFDADMIIKILNARAAPE